ncbi:MAG: FkbM family methyltransferase [Actinobacteria bacterium]|nr:FkbM family methyltransferase [Actinomycetota bacterium]
MRRLRSLMGRFSPYEDVQLLGETVRVRAGTIRSQPDYDDAWTLFLLRQAVEFIDIGCNRGRFGLMSVVDAPERRLLSIDASRAALAVAADNLVLNGRADRLRFLWGFVSDAPGEIEFWTTAEGGAAGSRYSSHARTAAHTGQHATVPTLSLDSIIEGTGWAPDLVKVDVEGAETEVLRGASQLAERQTARFLVEMHSPHELPMHKNAELVLDWTRAHSYTAYYLKDHVELSDPAQIAHRGRCHLLLQPSGWPYPERLDEIEQGSGKYLS